MKWKITKGKIVLLVIQLILFTMGYVFLVNNPDYHTYSPENVVETINGTKYVEMDCPETYYSLDNNIGYQDCNSSVRDPPPAYYIHQFLKKIRPYAIFIAIILILDVIRKEREYLKEVFSKMEI